MKGKRVIAGILLVGIIATALAGCKNTEDSKKETEKPVITLGSDNYPPYTYLDEDGVPTGIDVDLAAEAFGRMEDHEISWKADSLAASRSAARHYWRVVPAANPLGRPPGQRLAQQWHRLAGLLR